MKDKAIRLFLVEDDKVDQMAFKRLVKKMELPYDYTIAGSIAEAAGIMKSKSFDIIILDYWLGDGTSFELFDLFKELPVIVTTGTGNEEVAVEAMKLGACDYLIKDPEGNYLKTLPSTVNLALKRKQNEKELQNYHVRLESMVDERTAELQAEIIEREKVEQTYRELVEGTSDLITQVNGEGNLLYVNHVGKEIFGSAPEKLIGQNAFQFIHADDLESTKAWFENCLNRHLIQTRIENRQVNQETGVVRDMLWTCNFHYDEQGKAVSITGIARDITERKKIETAIRTSEKQWDRTFNSFTDIVTLQDTDLCILKANQAAGVILDLPCDEIIGHHCYELFCGAKAPCRDCPLLETKKTFEPNSREMYHQKLGKIFLVSASPVFDAQGELEYIAHVGKDISKLKKLENDLFQAQKMEAVGTLAGGIAHDFNNILSAIIGYAELIKNEVSADSPVGMDIEKVLISGQRAADLVKQILAFSRKTDTEKQPFRPHLIIKEALKMLRATLPTTIYIREDIDPDCGVILADPTNIHQITANLCTNALHAMTGQKGILSVSLQCRDVSAGQNGAIPLSSGPFVVLSVSDTGCGMDQKTIDRIFEPYFTTKAVGAGTGLGLSVIHGIVKDAQGFIEVKSALGKGSSFAVYLPVLQEKTATAPASDQIVSPQEGSEHILVVDDDPFLVRVTQRQLENIGYRVTATANSKDALEKIRSTPDEFDLLITDQTMPGLTGAELALAVMEIKADFPIILCTGHSDLVSEEKALELGIKKYVAKPIAGDELFQAVRSVLDGK